MFTFFHDSDIHFGTRYSEIPDTVSIRVGKKRNVENIIRETASLQSQGKDILGLIVTGDLTDHQWSSKSCFPCCGEKDDEYHPLINEYVDPLDSVLPVYLCAGNHDHYETWPYYKHPVLDLIEKRHDGLCYAFEFKGVHFICCDRCPKGERLEWLRDHLVKYTHENQPIVLFFHYNVSGPAIEFWASKQKDDDENSTKRKHKALEHIETFYDAIKSYNVISILVGHLHGNYTEDFHGIQVISSAGPGFAKCQYDPKTQTIQAKFFE